MFTRGRLAVSCIISGGQTGVDRGALDAALRLGIEHGGWCPKGRLAEDGCIPPLYQLRETTSAEYPQRTERNVIDSDGTLILYRSRMYGGTRLTHRLTRKHAKPSLRVDLSDDPDAGAVRSWLAERGIEVLNVAGPRESSAPGIADETSEFLAKCLEGNEPGLNEPGL